MSESPSSPAKGISKETARAGLDRIQVAVGFMLLASAVTGAYLLATDRSLWLLALSHAIGLVLIVALDVLLGILSLGSSRRVYLPSVAAAILGVVLQLGDILTAPQYSMTVYRFASYLFGLWAFDLLLALQVAVIPTALLGREYATYLSRRKSRRGREMTYSRRGFLKAIGGFAGLIGVGVVLGSIKIPLPSKANVTTTTTQSGVPKGSIANINDLKVGTPVYFQYPQGYPNILLKKADGTVSALSLLCTHVCCECEYVPSNSVIACPCHGSVFDSNGNVLQGPAAVALPTVEISIDNNGYVIPTGVSNPGPCQV